MKVKFKVNDKVEIEAEGTNHKEVFAQLSSLGEVFGAAECGCCKSRDIRPVVRTVTTQKGKKSEEFTYYEYHCLNFKCRARLAFGQSKENNALYPKRKDDEGNWIQNNGWVKYEKPAEEAS